MNMNNIFNAKHIFLGMKGAPYESELFTSVLRITNAALQKGHRVTVWTCGGATTLTQSSLGLFKRRNVLIFGTGSKDKNYPTTATLVGKLIGLYPDQLTWLVCRQCMEERGVVEHIASVKVVSPGRFLHYLMAADSSIIMGKK